MIKRILWLIIIRDLIVSKLLDSELKIAEWSIMLENTNDTIRSINLNDMIEQEKEKANLLRELLK